MLTAYGLPWQQFAYPLLWPLGPRVRTLATAAEGQEANSGAQSANTHRRRLIQPPDRWPKRLHHSPGSLAWRENDIAVGFRLKM